MVVRNASPFPPLGGRDPLPPSGGREGGAVSRCTVGVIRSRSTACVASALWSGRLQAVRGPWHRLCGVKRRQGRRHARLLALGQGKQLRGGAVGYSPVELACLACKLASGPNRWVVRGGVGPRIRRLVTCIRVWRMHVSPAVPDSRWSGPDTCRGGVGPLHMPLRGPPGRGWGTGVEPKRRNVKGHS